MKQIVTPVPFKFKGEVPSKDFLESVIEEQKELDESMKESFRQRDERKEKEKNETEKLKLKTIQLKLDL
jgi:hypothetical protein